MTHSQDVNEWGTGGFNVSSSIQATKLIARLYDESDEIIKRTLKFRENNLSLDEYETGEFRAKLEIISDTSGYLESIEFKEILFALRDLEAEFILKIDIQYSWNALFYRSKDGLPFIGRDPGNPDMYYLLGYGGNGTCYSIAGAFILSDLINGKPNIYEKIVRVDR